MPIRSLERKDYDAWLPLWIANCENQISENVTLETWRRLTNPKENVYGLGTFDEHGNLQGILHYILHATTGHIEPACYMQDLYVKDNMRRQGLAKRLVWELNDIGKEQKWSRIYWFAEKDNIATQNLYKNLGIRMNISLHTLQTR